MLKPITVRPRPLTSFPLMENLGALLRRDAELRAWPPPEPEAERDRLLDQYERNRQEEAEGSESEEP
jgi:hypothetical protein